MGGIGAQELIAEIGIEMSRFPSAAHLVSSANLAPTKASAGKTRVQLHRQGKPLDRRHHRGGGHGRLPDHDLPWAPATDGSSNDEARNARWSPSATQVLTIPYHLLWDPHARFADLGADFHDRLHPQRRTRQLIRELEYLSGRQVTLHTAA